MRTIVDDGQSRMDDSTRTQIAESLDALANQDVWNADVWQRCYDLVDANTAMDPLVEYVFDDIIHYSGRRLLRSKPIPADFNQYRQEFRDVAAALRERLSLTEAREKYGL